MDERLPDEADLRDSMPTIRDLYIRWILARARLESDAIEQGWSPRRLLVANQYVDRYYRMRARSYIDARAVEEYSFPQTNITD